MRRFYLVTRDLHLYVGLFISPFVLVFAISVFYLVHGLADRPAPGPSEPSRTVANVIVSPDIARLQGRARVDALRPVLEQLGVHGEIDFVRHVANEHQMIVPVRIPDRDTVVTIDNEQRTADVTSRNHGMGEAFVYLHKMPGPHNADVRGNSGLIRVWRVVADATGYLVLFITISGIYLWVAPGPSAVWDCCCCWPAQARSGGWCMPSQLDDGITAERRSAAPPARFSCGTAGFTTSSACTYCSSRGSSSLPDYC